MRRVICERIQRGIQIGESILFIQEKEVTSLSEAYEDHLRMILIRSGDSVINQMKWVYSQKGWNRDVFIRSSLSYCFFSRKRGVFLLEISHSKVEILMSLKGFERRTL